jgi:hypothetical protein
LSEIDETGEPAERPNRMMKFRRTANKLPADSARRQGEVTHLAFLRLGGRDAAVAFLNAPDDALGGRPIDIASARAEGAAAVIAAIEERAGPAANQA